MVMFTLKLCQVFAQQVFMRDLQESVLAGPRGGGGRGGDAVPKKPVDNFQLCHLWSSAIHAQFSEPNTHWGDTEGGFPLMQGNPPLWDNRKPCTKVTLANCTWTQNVSLFCLKKRGISADHTKRHRSFGFLAQAASTSSQLNTHTPTTAAYILIDISPGITYTIQEQTLRKSQGLSEILKEDQLWGGRWWSFTMAEYRLFKYWG